MCHALGRGELACFDVESHFLVCIAERHTISCQTVDLFDREHQVVTRIVEDVLVDRDMFEHESHHAQAVLQLVEGWQEHLLDDLKVAEIARWQIVHYEHDLLWHSLNLVALGTCELKHIRILLVRHDARARGKCVVELDEAEVLARIHASVEGKLCQCCCYAT